MARPLILYVDDDVARRGAGSARLRAAGFDVLETAAGEALVSGTPPRLGLIIQAVDDETLTRRLRGLFAPLVPLLYLTARSDSVTGADRCLSPPPDPEALLVAVEELVALWPAVQAALQSLLAQEPLLEQMTDAVIVQAPSGRPIHANGATLRLLEVDSLQELLQRDALEGFELLDDEGRVVARRELPGRRVLAGEEAPPPMVVRWHRLGGEVDDRWTEVRAWPVRDEAGRYLLVLSLLHDLTERRQLEQRLHLLHDATLALTSSRDYDALLARIVRLPVPILGDWSVLQLVDQDEVRAFVHHRDPALDEPLRRRVGPARPLGDRAGLPTALFTGRAAIDAVPLGDDRIAGDLSPELTFCSAMEAPLLVGGQPFGVLGVRSGQPRRYGPQDLELLQDLADRAALALDNARTLARAHSAAELRRDLLAVVAHDLKNPLNAIGMATALLAKKAPAGAAGESARRQTTMITRAAHRMDRLISDLLDVSAIEVGRLSLHPQPVRAAALVQEAIDLFTPLLQERQLTLQLQAPPPQLQIFADSERLLQVLSNLLGNACKFTPPGGHIQVGAVTEEERLRFFVADDGPGIAPEHLSHLFDRFWQMRNRRRDGTGLGLWIAKGLISAHGGEIWVESTPGQGACFSFTIPLAP